MPQIGWFEILIIVVLAILIIGPKDFPIILNKIGNWFGVMKRHFTQMQKEVSDIKNTVDDEIDLKNNISNKIREANKDE